MLKRVFALLCVLLLALPLAAGAERSILDFKATQSGTDDWAEDGLPDMMGKGGEWYAIALAQAGGYDLSACRTVLEDYVTSTKVRSATTRQKLALTLLALGSDHPFVETTLADSIGKQGVMSWAWGLHLLNNVCQGPTYTDDEVVSTLLTLRKADGGWAVTGDVSDVDATAMVLQALAPHQDDGKVTAAIDGAVALLASRQTANGGFSSYGVENAESAAQVIIALCALNIDPAAPQFVKNGASPLDALAAFRLEDGSFSHEMGGAYNENATAQAFLAAVAYARFKEGEGSIFLLDGDQQPGQLKVQLSYKAVAAVVIGGAAVLACIALLIAGKRHPKNFLAVAMIAAALLAVLLMTDFQSAEDYYAVTAVAKDDAIGSITLTIRCDKVAGRAAHIPENGVILEETSLPIASGDTVYTILTDAARMKGFHMEASGAQGMMYVHGIGNIYEFDFGDLSGWLYTVNGETHSVGVDQYVLKDGDRVELRYTLELGRDMD